MKRFLRVGFAGILAVSMLTFVGCEKVSDEVSDVTSDVLNEAEEFVGKISVEAYFETLRSGDVARAVTLANNQVSYDEAVLLDLTKAQQESMMLIYPFVSVVVNSEDVVSEDEIVVNADVTAISMDSVLGSLFEIVQAEPSLTSLSDEQKAALESVDFKNAVDSNKDNLVTSNLDISVRKIDGNYMMVLDDSVMKAILGGSEAFKLGFDLEPAE